ncbi:MAG TPA: FTR1 family protein [Alphaproteobacteria bacterium]|nr:FTR1 family protein [Alphaproteobacteria bacterium]HNS45216.1 FTR1 family protein [Alphaproteobacteria bacterium]
MIETALIVFRESLEAFLIVAITIAYLTQTGRRHLSPAIYVGLVAAIGLSAYLGLVIEDMADNPIAEGLLAFAAGGLVATMTIHVMKTAKNIKSNITNHIDRHAEKSTFAAVFGLFAFTILMVTREGMETALMLGSLSKETNAEMLFGGAALGMAATMIIGLLWVKHSKAINLKLFLQTTGIFLVLFALHLFMTGVHELSEASAIPFVDNTPIHIATEIFDPNLPLAQFILYSLIAVPCLWLGIAIFRDKREKRRVSVLHG